MSSSQVGQLIIMGVPGPRLTNGLRELIRRIQPGGFILFARNLSEPQQVFELVAEFRELCDVNPIVTIDQEGGRVSRLRMIGEEPPSGRALRESDNIDWCRLHGKLTGQLLHNLGFNLNLAPVIDYNEDEERDNSLRGRCFGSSPQEVITKAGAFLEGMQAEGVLGTIKHFPGYTHCAVDPHGDLPRIDRSREEMGASELLPFAALGPVAPVVMVGHGHFPAWHETPVPASLSPRIITELLRGELGYGGAVMTDDLEMGAVINQYGSAEVTRLALEAGADLLLFCHNPACIEISFDQLQSMDPALLQPALQRVTRLKDQLPTPPQSFDLPAFQTINAEIGNLRQEVEAKLGSRSGHDGDFSSPVFGA